MARDNIAVGNRPNKLLRNIKEVLEAHLVLRNISPDLSSGLLETAGRPDFDMEAMDGLFEVAVADGV